MAHIPGQPEPEQPDDEVTVASVGPDPRLLFGLVVLVGLVLAAVLFSGSGGDDRVELGSLTELAAQAEAGPIRLAELPHLVVTRAPTPQAVYDTRWGDSTGAILLSPHEQLVVLETRDPEDGAELSWCRAANAFAHPDGDRWYGPDGTLLAGRGRRGMDRRALVVVGGSAVAVDDDRWIGGVPLQSTDTAWTPRGSCLD